MIHDDILQFLMHIELVNMKFVLFHLAITVQGVTKK